MKDIFNEPLLFIPERIKGLESRSESDAELANSRPAGGSNEKNLLRWSASMGSNRAYNRNEQAFTF